MPSNPYHRVEPSGHCNTYPITRTSANDSVRTPRLKFATLAPSVCDSFMALLPTSVDLYDAVVGIVLLPVNNGEYEFCDLNITLPAPRRADDLRE